MTTVFWKISQKFTSFKISSLDLEFQISVSEFLIKPQSRSFNEVSVSKVTVSTKLLLFSVAKAKRKHNWNWYAKYFILRIRFNKISLFRMLLQRLKLHRITAIFRWCGTNFSYTQACKLHHLATLFDNTNVISNPEMGGQIVRGVFCQTFTKSCQISNHKAKILAKFCKMSSLNDFLDKVLTVLDKVLTVLPVLRLIRHNSKFESGGLGPCPPGSATHGSVH